MPNSARCPRRALMTWVRCRTRRSRARNTRAAAWVCSLLGATKRMVGRWAASQIASASVALFCIRGIVLLPLDEWLDVRRRDQPDRMPEHANLARPIMGAAAGLHGDRAGGLGRKEGANLAPPQPLAEHNRS